MQTFRKSELPDGDSVFVMELILIDLNNLRCLKTRTEKFDFLIGWTNVTEGKPFPKVRINPN